MTRSGRSARRAPPGRAGRGYPAGGRWLAQEPVRRPADTRREEQKECWRAEQHRRSGLRPESGIDRRGHVRNGGERSFENQPRGFAFYRQLHRDRTAEGLPHQHDAAGIDVPGLHQIVVGGATVAIGALFIGIAGALAIAPIVVEQEIRAQIAETQNAIEAIRNVAGVAVREEDGCHPRLGSSLDEPAVDPDAGLNVDENLFKGQAQRLRCDVQRRGREVDQLLLEDHEEECRTNHDAEEPISVELVEWADIIVVMEKQQRNKVNKKFRKNLNGKRVLVLNIPDDFDYMQPELVRLLEAKVPALVGLLGLQR